MSKIGKKPLAIPQGVEVVLDGSTVKVTGPKGVLSWTHPEGVKIEQHESELTFSILSDEHKNLWGLTRTLVANMVEGVSNGYEKKLLIIGVGYSAKLEGKTLVLSLGFAHKVNYLVPEGIEMKVEQDPKGNTVVIISGISKELVGEVAAKIRAYKKPEPYKGKGIRYFDEYVKIKPGKSAKK
ncbi:MAG: 50S ribosomal protein L6 [candidate division SR1 bacterium]|nr:MAG: 50S ribosomal protein L6 [candidate division SR1 bacterium]